MPSARVEWVAWKSRSGAAAASSTGDSACAMSRSRSGGSLALERRLQVLDQVVRILESDAQANETVAMAPVRPSRPSDPRYRKTRDPAPAVAHRKELQPVDEGDYVGSFIRICENQGEDACRTREIARPELMSRTRGERRMQYDLDLRARGKPAGDRRGEFLDGGEANCQGRKPAGREPQITRDTANPRR